MKIAGFVLGIISVVFGLIPGSFVIGLITGIVGIVFSAYVMKKEKAEGNVDKMTKAGLILSIIGTSIALIMLIVAIILVTSLVGSYTNTLNSLHTNSH